MKILHHEDLNEEQILAIEEEQSVFLVACPGSGKTRTLTYKIVEELSKIESMRSWVVAITYTNRAADEIKDRLEAIGISTRQLWVGTIHSFCLDWIVKPYGIYHDRLRLGYTIINSYESEEILNEICERHKKLNGSKATHWDCAHYFDSAGVKIACKAELRTSVQQILSEYDSYLAERRLVDFERILLFAFELVRIVPKISHILSNLFTYILIDEFQDTKEVQYQIISSILRAGKGLVKAFIVGDPNQAIFNSLGGYAISKEEFSTMSNLQLKEMELSKNYRNSEKIVDYYSNYKVFNSTIESSGANRDYESIISLNTTASRETVVDEITRLIRFNIEEKCVPMSEVCVVGPWWIHLAALTRGLVSNLPEYRFNGPGLTPFVRDIENVFYKLSRLILTKPSPKIYVRRLRWAREIIEYLHDIGIDTSEKTPRKILRIINSLNIDEQDGLKYLSKCFEAIFEATGIRYLEIQCLIDYREAFFESANARISRIRKEHGEYKADVEMFFRAFEASDGITVSSIHGVKGAEFEVIIAFALLEGAVPNFKDENPRENAKKLLYVICSRARKNIHLIAETGRTQFRPTLELSSLSYDYSLV